MVQQLLFTYFSCIKTVSEDKGTITSVQNQFVIFELPK